MFDQDNEWTGYLLKLDGAQFLVFSADNEWIGITA